MLLHVATGEGDEPGDCKHITYGEALAATCQLANALKTLGVGKGDRVCLYMPMVPEAAYAMLACARIGAIHSVVVSSVSPRPTPLYPTLPRPASSLSSAPYAALPFPSRQPLSCHAVPLCPAPSRPPKLLHTIYSNHQNVPRHPFHTQFAGFSAEALRARVEDSLCKVMRQAGVKFTPIARRVWTSYLVFLREFGFCFQVVITADEGLRAKKILKLKSVVDKVIPSASVFFNSFYLR